MSGLTVLLIGKTLLFYFVMTGIMYMTGSGISKIAGINSTKLERVSLGFVVQLALIQLFGWFFMAFRWSTAVFAILVLLVSLLGLLMGFYKQAYKSERPERNWTDLLPVGMLLIQIILTFLMYRSDADDSFYVSNVTLFQNSSVLNPYDASFGIPSLGTVPMYDFGIWEAYAAVLGNFFHIEGVTLMHFVFVPWLLVLSASAYLFLGRALFQGNQTKGNYFYLLLSVFHLMGGNAAFSQGSFLLSRIWQGKSVYLHVVLPLLMAVLLSCIVDKQEEEKCLLERYLFVPLFVCILAGAALNPTSLYVLGFQLAAMLLVVAIYKRKIRLLWHALPAIFTVGLFTLLIYFRASHFDGQIEAASGTGDAFVFHVFENFFGSGMLYFVLYILAALIILVLGNARAKISFVFTPVILFLSIWNPVTGKIVAETLTKAPSYWRVFWLLPVGMALSYAVVLVATRLNYDSVGVLLGCILIVIPGTWMFSTENNFVRATNVERIPEEVMEFSHTFLEENERPVILASDDLSTTLRQKYNQVELIFSRHQYILDLFTYRGKSEEGAERTQLMSFSNGHIDDETSVIETLAKYPIDFVILKKDYENSCQLMERLGWRIADQSSDYNLYSLEK